MDKILKLKMNLQMFAGDDGSNGGADGASDNEEVINLTPKELQSKLDAEAEKRVAKVIAKKETEWQEKLKQEREEAKKEGMSYGQMTEKQQREAEEKAAREAFEEERKKFYQEKLTMEVADDLKKKNLPSGVFADVLASTGDKEAIAAKVTELKAELDSWLAEQLKVNARQETPNETNNFSGGNKNTAKSIREFANKNRLIKGE